MAAPGAAAVEVHSARRSLLDQLVHPPSTSLLCSICQDIFQDPVINPACSHSFCRICIYQAVQMANRCPLCRAPLSNDKVHPNLALAGLIGDLRAWCRYRELGCTTQLALDDIAAHEKSCSFAPLNCPHSARGCKVAGNQRLLAEHLRVCPYEMFRDFLDAIDRKYALLEKRIEAQAGEIAALRSALGRGGHSNGAEFCANGLPVVSRPPSAAADALDVEVRPLRQVNLDKVECLATIANAHTSGVTALCPAQLGDRFVLYTGSHDAKIKVWFLVVCFLFVSASSFSLRCGSWTCARGRAAFDAKWTRTSTRFGVCCACRRKSSFRRAQTAMCTAGTRRRCSGGRASP